MHANLAAAFKLALSIGLLLNVIPGGLAFPGMIPSSRSDALGGVPVTIPKPMNFTGAKLIPDVLHPFIPPGPFDQRGPCPGLNTLANHGYLPRSGIVSFEDLLNAAQEGFNLDYTFTAAIAAFAILSRGNALINRVSIGGESPLVPPLPGNIDGTPGGLAKHGRFEGDISATREDAALGDHVHFQPDMFANLLTYVDNFGVGDVVTQDVFVNYRFDRFKDSLARNPNLTYHVGRMGFSYGEAGFILNLLPNSMQGNLTVPVMTSFFAHERFPANWHRRGSPFTFADVGDAVDGIIAPHLVSPGEKNASGVYVPDTGLDDCSLYFNLAGQNLPAVLMNTTGLLRQNVNLLLDVIHTLFSDTCAEQLPIGPAKV